MVLGSWESLQAGRDHCGAILNEPQVEKGAGQASGRGNSQAIGKKMESVFGREE